MAIITENIQVGNKKYIKTYSDEDRYVVRDGVSYTMAIDPINTGRIYTEGDIIEPEIVADEILSILMGEAL